MHGFAILGVTQACRSHPHSTTVKYMMSRTSCFNYLIPSMPGAIPEKVETETQKFIAAKQVMCLWSLMSSLSLMQCAQIHH